MELINANEKWVKRLVKINYTRYFFLLVLNITSFYGTLLVSLEVKD